MRRDPAAPGGFSGEPVAGLLAAIVVALAWFLLAGGWHCIDRIVRWLTGAG